ncbi:MAG: hypothetical protein ABIQ30_04060 [Devosia sp.]
MQRTMTSGYSKRLCAYCQLASSTRQGDHIFAREFFLEAQRANLPKAPCCATCNGAKARHEHYLTAVLPFGGRHDDAVASIEATETRLGENLRLKRELEDGLELGASPDGSSLVPFQDEHLRGLFEMIPKGLLWYHAGVYLPENYGALAFAAPSGAVEPNPNFGPGAETYRGNLGNGVFEYEGVTNPSDRFSSAWVFKLFGGAKFLTDAHEFGEDADRMVALTGPADMFDELRAQVDRRT